MSNCCTVIAMRCDTFFVSVASCLVTSASFFRPTVLILLIWAISASLHPLDVHEYVFGVQSC